MALVSSAEAALKMPTKVAPARVQPLGKWTLVDQNPTAAPGTTVEVLLAFRSDIDVLDPYINVWPDRVPLPPLPRPVPAPPDQPRIVTPIPVGSRHRPQERRLGQELVGGVLVTVPVRIAVDAGTCSNTFRITVQMSDGPTTPADVRAPGPTRRRASFGFMLKVVTECTYTRRVTDPLLPATGRLVNNRPTSVPRPTNTPAVDRSNPTYVARLQTFRTPTRTPRP